ncbi:hypothetical protein TNCV_2115151 [Trichonephila clavipes]|nr:hypothetical protein TNCV_2115151 [Trichonephila clavipes]
MEKIGVPTDHREEDTTGRTSSIQKRQRNERLPLHRISNKIKQQECQARRGSTTTRPGKERSVYEKIYILGGLGRKRQLQVIRTRNDGRSPPVPRKLPLVPGIIDDVQKSLPSAQAKMVNHFTMNSIGTKIFI